MEEADAEAVRAALGPALEWIPYGGKENTIAFTQTGTYTIGTLDGRGAFGVLLRTAAVVWSRNLRGVFCKLLAAAKAACKRHHATGK